MQKYYNTFLISFIHKDLEVDIVNCEILFCIM